MAAVQQQPTQYLISVDGERRYFPDAGPLEIPGVEFRVHPGPEPRRVLAGRLPDWWAQVRFHSYNAIAIGERHDA